MTCIKTVRRVLIGACLSAASLGACAQPQDADVLLAKDAAQKGQWKQVEVLRARLAGHPLEAYPTYWMLAGSAARADPADMRAFLERNADSPLAESLRREWLKALGAAGDWATFRAELPRFQGEDAEIACYAFQERLARDDAEVASEIRAHFLSVREPGAACEPAYGALVASGRITEADTWERLRLVLAANLPKEAKRANALLPARHRFNDRTLDRAGAEPGAFLAREKSPVLSRAAKELAFFAVARLARSKPEEAAERLALIAPRLGPEAEKAAWAQVAWQAALVHHPRALEWYAKAGDATLTDSQRAWRARAALRAENWKELLAAIQALPPEEARESGWRYWRARALRAQGENEASTALLRGVAREPGFYGLLAAEETNAVALPDWTGWKPAPGDLDRAKAMPGIARALILYRLGLDAEGFREWTWAIRGLGDRDLLAAAEVAREAGIPDRAINTANRAAQLQDYPQRFPLPHREALAASARQWNLDEAMVYALIRQESRFMPEVRSRVGATGLMQLMPATARWVARQIGFQPFNTDMLRRPDVNLTMGTYYFSRVLADLGHAVLATAAYNAGPGRARRWRDERPLEGAIYAETIPFNETRDYVKNVFTNAWYYRHRLTGQAPSLRALLGTVPGRAGEPEAAVASVIP